MSEINTAWLLAQWALWQREGVGLQLRAKSPLAFLSKVSDEELERKCSEISDDDALRVDRAMAQLKKVNPTWYKVLVWAFVFDLGDRAVAARLGVTRYAAGRLYEEAYGWVDSLAISEPAENLANPEN